VSRALSACARTVKQYLGIGGGDRHQLRALGMLRRVVRARSFHGQVATCRPQRGRSITETRWWRRSLAPNENALAAASVQVHGLALPRMRGEPAHTGQRVLCRTSWLCFFSGNVF
jgi:hypothetical protein